MLIRQSGNISPGVSLIAHGSQVNYVVGNEKKILVDTTLSCETPKLISKLEEVGISPAHLYGIALTHLHAERVAGAVVLKQQFPHLKLICSSQMEALINNSDFINELKATDHDLAGTLSNVSLIQRMSVEQIKEILSPNLVLREGDLLNLGRNYSIRMISAPGHTSHSVAYLIQPDNVLIVDEGFGYFKIKGFTASGADWSIEEATRSIERTTSLEISALALPHLGALTGNLIRKHLKTVLEFTQGMLAECKEAFELNMNESEIQDGLRTAFYKDETMDATSTISLERSLKNIWTQVQTTS